MKKRIFILLFIIAAIICAISYFIGPIFPRYVSDINLVFRKAVAGCDKVVIRDGCYDPTEKYYSNKALRVLDDPCDVRNFINAIRFSCFQKKRVCGCEGWPAIDFYSNGKIIMITSLKHNIALHTPIIDYDAGFTNDTKKFFEGLVTGLNSEVLVQDKQ
jgi:hypothetical protein